MKVSQWFFSAFFLFWDFWNLQQGLVVPALPMYWLPAISQPKFVGRACQILWRAGGGRGRILSGPVGTMRRDLRWSGLLQGHYVCRKPTEINVTSISSEAIYKTAQLTPTSHTVYVKNRYKFSLRLDIVAENLTETLYGCAEICNVWR